MKKEWEIPIADFSLFGVELLEASGGITLPEIDT